jgi:hypothetical protein
MAQNFRFFCVCLKCYFGSSEISDLFLLNSLSFSFISSGVVFYSAKIFEDLV